MKQTTIFTLLLLVSLAASAQTRIYQDVSVQQFKAKLDSLPDAVVLDLRTDDEVKGGVISKAVQIDYFAKDFLQQLDKLDRSKVYFVYCAGGGRSGETIDLMEQKGFRCVYNLEGGFTAWKQQKMPVEPGPRQ